MGFSGPQYTYLKDLQPISRQQRRHVKKLLFKISTPKKINIFSWNWSYCKIHRNISGKILFLFSKKCKIWFTIVVCTPWGSVSWSLAPKEDFEPGLFFFSSKMSILEKIEKGVCYSEQSQKWIVGTTISKNEFLINVWWDLRQ